MADSYTVTGQQYTTIIEPAGGIVEGVEVTFTTKPSGVVGRITVRRTAYNTDAVDQAIRAEVTIIEAVQQL